MTIHPESRTTSFFIFQEHSAFIPLKFVYPECNVLIERHPKVYPLACFGPIDCPANIGCGEIIAKRVHYLFEQVVPTAKQLIVYFKYRDAPDRLRAGVFDKDLESPRVIVVNPWAFKKIMKESLTYQWHATDEYLFMSGSGQIIPVERLIR